jgi:hypothetical protein
MTHYVRLQGYQKQETEVVMAAEEKMMQEKTPAVMMATVVLTRAKPSSQSSR